MSSEYDVILDPQKQIELEILLADCPKHVLNFISLILKDTKKMPDTLLEKNLKRMENCIITSNNDLEHGFYSFLFILFNAEIGRRKID